MLRRNTLGLVLSGLAQVGLAAPLEEVLVQAQRREQSLQDVAVAISVRDAQQIRQQRLLKIEDLAPTVPGLSGWEQGPSTPIYAIRGISSNSFGIGGEASVAVFVNEAYRGRINSTSLALYDVDQIEVLKGAQGTLFGRNASAGAILIRQKTPTDDTTAELTLEGGDHGYQAARATVNLDLAGPWGARATAFYASDEGFTDNRLLGEQVADRNQRGGQAVISYQTATLSANLWLATQQNQTGGLGYETLDPALAAAGGVAPDPFDSVLATDIRTFDDVESQDISLDAHWQLNEQLSLTSITAWHDNDSPNLFDVDGSAVFLTSAGFTERHSETWSQELRLSGNHSAVDWVAGVMLFQEDISTLIELAYSDTNLFGGLCNSPLLQCQDRSDERSLQNGDYFSAGAFGDLSWALTEQWTLSLGLRYSSDDKRFDYRADPVTSVVTLFNASELNPSGNLLGYSTQGKTSIKESWDDWQPRLALNWRYSDHHRVFTNLAKGYKAGGFEPAATPALSTFAPEQVWNLDAGASGGWSGVSYQLNAFAYRYDDYQVQVIANGLARTSNVSGVDGHGLEMELAYQATPNVSLQLSGAWLNAEFDEFLTDAGDLQGNSPILAPEYSGSFSARWRSKPASWGSLSANWLALAQSRIYFTVQNSNDAKQGAFQRHNMVFSYHARADHWQLDLFVRNVLDEEYVIFEQDVGAGPVSRRGEPRVWGASFSMRL